MALTIVVGTNSYETEAESVTYHEGSIHGASWATSINRKEALVTAFRDISLYSLIDPDTGVAVDPSNAPQGLKDAQSEYALVLSQDPSLALSTGHGGSNIKSVGAGSAKVSFFRPEDKSRFPSIVGRLLAPFLAGNSGSGIQGSSANGSDVCPQLGSPRSQLTQGWM